MKGNPQNASVHRAFGKGFVMNQKVLKNGIIISCILLLFMFSACFVRNTKQQQVLQEVTLEYVKDGDTISVKESDGNVVTVRLIGIDAPESVAPENYTEKTGKENNEYGEKASEHLKELLDGAETLYLEFDTERVDQYDRVLAYVYLSDSGSFDDMVNARMLSDGYATIMEIEPNTKYADRFLNLKEDAKKQGTGLWQFGDFMTAKGSEVPSETESETEPVSEIESESESVEEEKEEPRVAYGIDVSKYQGTIDWAKVAAAGIEFAMIRVGYRDPGSGYVGADSYAEYNLQEAEKNGVQIGVYFFSTAASEEEARADADWVADYISPYSITYPVVFDCEGFQKESSRQFPLTQEERSNVAMAFMERISERGYTPMIYADVKDLEGDAKWDTSRIEEKYKVWIASYNQDTSNLENKPAYNGKFFMWQYSNTGRVEGIGAQVDLDVAYFGYD